MAMKFDVLPEFAREFHRLAKKYRSLPNDLEELKRVLIIKPLGTGKHFTTITRQENIYILKARLFCLYLKGSSLRIIYACHLAVSRVEFIEIYFKGEKENENRERIKEYLKSF